MARDLITHVQFGQNDIAECVMAARAARNYRAAALRFFKAIFTLASGEQHHTAERLPPIFLDHLRANARKSSCRFDRIFLKYRVSLAPVTVHFSLTTNRSTTLCILIISHVHPSTLVINIGGLFHPCRTRYRNSCQMKSTTQVSGIWQTTCQRYAG